MLALRKRDKVRNTTTRERPSQGADDVLVEESRQLMKLGKLNEAEAKAPQAQRMNVVPALTADRAESALHDIAMARVRSVPSSPAATPAAGPPSLVAELEANDLLEKGDQAKAAAKFAESEKLRVKESGRAAIGQAAATAAPSVDASIQKSSGAEPATSRCLRHPARLDRRPLISLPLLPSTASPSLNRLPRAMCRAGTRRGWIAGP